MMQFFKKSGDTGITLIALVITIIVLLILAGVTIAALSGDNGILKNAAKAKEMMSIAQEKEVIQIVATKGFNKNNNVEIGEPLYSKTLENSNKWNIIAINDTQTIYGNNYRYIAKGTDIKNYGITTYNWLLNCISGELIQLEEGKYTKLSYSDNLAVTDGLIFNIDANNMNNNDLNTWGNNVSMYGFENNPQTDSNGLFFDGIDDYVEFKSSADYSQGFTLSFYGKIDVANTVYYFFSKQKDSSDYSCRFSLSENFFTFNTSKNRADSKWSNNDTVNNGLLDINCSYVQGDIWYFDLTFNADTNEFKLYENNKFIDSDIVNESYWHGENGGKQIFEDDNIFCYLGRVYGGVGGGWHYSKYTLYALRLYNRPLNESELNNNYTKTLISHKLDS